VSRNPTPDPDPLVGDLLDPGNEPDAEDVVVLIGFLGPGRQAGSYRIHADRGLQRWLEVPGLIHSRRIDAEDELSRSVVWVDRQMMLEPIFENEQGENDGRLGAVAESLEDAPFSSWNLIPETRLVAAGLLGLIAYGEEEEGGSGEAWAYP
jgi:hypothetical protein